MKKILICGFMLVLVFIAVSLKINDKKNESVLYSWSMDALDDEDLLDIIKKHNVHLLYQDFNTKYLEGSNDEFIKKMLEIDAEVYHLCGEIEWGLEKDASSMIKEIDKVIFFNKNVSNKIKGIIFDIETYQNSIEEFDFSLYVSNMKKAYEYAKKNNIKMHIAIPIWFDKININELEDLIQNGCDGISLMNYNIKNTLENMRIEIELAKKYNKDINTIYEINFLNDNYFSSYDEIDLDFKKIYKKYSYSKLKKAYHHYTKMKENYD